jgi:hypothetical protein
MSRTMATWNAVAALALLVMGQALAAEEPARRQKAPPESQALRKVIYDVGDLVLPIPRLYLGTPPSAETTPRQADNAADFDSLIDLIESVVKPETWDVVGGRGSISRSKADSGIVVNQTQEVHDEIANLIDQLRRLIDLDVAIKLTISSVADEAMPAELRGQDTTHGVILPPQQAKQLASEAKRQCSADIVQSRFTAQNGQPAIVAVSALKGGAQGTVLEIQSCVSDDRRFIRLSMIVAVGTTSKRVVTASVPVGDTFLVELPADVGQRRQGDAGKPQGKTPEVHRLVLLTPRIVMDAEGQDRRKINYRPIRLPPPVVPSYGEEKAKR